MDHWYLLAKARQQELYDWAEQRRLVKQVSRGREKGQRFRRVILWVADQMIATGKRLEQRYQECCTQELEVLVKPGG
jgi:hypothetical protein